MIAAQDLQKDYIAKNKYGFKAEFTDQVLDVILRKHFNMPDGEIERISVDYERMIVSFYYRSEKPKLMPCRIGQAGEYPVRCEVKNES